MNHDIIDQNKIVVHCPLCPDPREITYQTFRKIQKSFNRPCKLHSPHEVRCQKIFGKELYPNYAEDEKNFLKGKLKTFTIQQLAEQIGMSERTVLYLIKKYQIRSEI